MDNQNLKTNESHMAVVLDDDERLKGLVTIEDLLEEIVGDIEGEVGWIWSFIFMPGKDWINV